MSKGIGVQCRGRGANAALLVRLDRRRNVGAVVVTPPSVGDLDWGSVASPTDESDIDFGLVAVAATETIDWGAL